jgi:hypothetical protein
MKASFIVSILLGLIAFACADSCLRNLYANDPYYQSVSLKDGFAGTISQNYRPYNRDSALSYNQYYANKITITPQGSDRGAFYDLGTNALFGYRYNVSLIGGNTAYSSIHVNKEGQIVYATTDIYNTDDSKAFQPFDSQITSTLQNLRSDMSALSFYPEVGHIYLINIYSGQYGETYLTKVVVLDVSADNATVTLRWDVIDSTREATRNSNCWISLDTTPPQGATDDNGLPDTSIGYYNFRPLIVAVSVILPVLFVMIVLLGVFMLVVYKKVKQVTGYYSTPVPKIDEKKPLIQK